VKIFAWVPFFLTLVIAQDNSLFFSEYAEGSWYNKYLEIYNGTGASVDLSNFSISSCSNGCDTDGEWDYPNNITFSAGTMLPDGAVYVIYHGDADPLIEDEGDQTFNYLSNGDDVFAITEAGATASSYTIIDIIGEMGDDPGDGWDVAGTSDATKDHTLVRKSTVTIGNTDWSASAGTATDNSEWIILDQDTWTYLGSHPHTELETNNPVISITSPTNSATLYSPDVTVSFAVNNFTVAASGGDGHLHYALDGGSTVMQYTVDDIELTGLSATDHSFIIWLVDDNHTNLDPYVADTVAFTVEEESDDITLIYDIQSGSFTDGTPVTIRGVVTAGTGETPDGSGLSIYIQDGQDQYSGINVYAPDNTVSRGDSIEVVGTTIEYYGKTEIENVTSITVLATGVSLPNPEILTLDESDWEPWEGVLIQIQSVTVSDDDAGYGEWDVSDGTNTFRIDNSYSDNYKLIPRDDDDIVLGGGPPSVTDISINPSSPTESDEVTVSASITDDGTIASATLTYNAGSGDTDVTMNNTSGDTYSETIPAQSAGTTVTFTITAVDNEDNSTTSNETSYLVISSGGPITAIYDIQYVSDPETYDASPLNGQTVTISGIVTAEFWGSSYNRTFFVQDSLWPWSGIMVYRYEGWDSFDFTTSSGIVHSVAEGDSVTLTGEVYEAYGKTEIKNVSEVIIYGSSSTMFAPMAVTVAQVMTGGADAEAYEGCLVSIVDVTINNPDLGNGEWSITDGTNSARVDDNWDYFYYPEAEQELAEVTGVLDFTFDDFKIQPRLARDVVEEEVTRIQRINQVLYSDLMKVAEDDSSDQSYFFDDTVTIEGIVTVATGLAFAGNDGGLKVIFEDFNGGPWSGIVCYDSLGSNLGNQPIGRKIRVTGRIDEYGSSTYDGNVTEIFTTQPIQAIGLDPVVPVDTISTGNFRDPLTGEQWGAVWVEILNATVIRNDLDYGGWTIDDGTGEIKIGTNSTAEEWEEWERPPVGSFVESIRGWVYNRHGFYDDSTAFKLEPNYPSDIIFGAGPPLITMVERDPCVPMDDDDVEISAIITDNSVVSEVTLYFRLYDESGNAGSWQSLSMNNSMNDEWIGIVAASVHGQSTACEYYIAASDDGVDQNEIKTSKFPDINNGNYLGFWSIEDGISVANIQYSPWPSGVSPYVDCYVSIAGIVTVDSVDYLSGSYNSYAMQSESEQWSGIFFDGEDLPGLSRGDEISITGKVIEHYGSTKIDSVSSITVLSTGNTLLPLDVGTADLAQDSDEPESYEGCLVVVSDVTVTSVNSYDWSIKDDSNISCLMDDDMATMEADNYMSTLEANDMLETVSGIFNYSFGTYKIQVRDMVDLGQGLTIEDEDIGLVKGFALYPNYPNPFNPETRIRFQLPQKSGVELVVYDMLGQRVRTLVTEIMDAGLHQVTWDGLNYDGNEVASGMYIYRIKAGGYFANQKMLLVR
jgi:predicted extracellular nuclease